MIGLKRGAVKLSSYHKQWAKLFETEKENLLSTLNQFKVNIEHVGSTAIPGVLAKPIIDILLFMPDSTDVQKIYAILEKQGYENRGEQGVPGRQLFVKGPEENRTHYLHITKQSNNERKTMILFRDYLRRHKNARNEYNELKKQLANKFPNNRPLYTHAKDEFIQQIIDQAKTTKKLSKKKGT